MKNNKRTILSLVTLSFALAGTPAISQELSPQLETAITEIVKLVELPNPEFKPNPNPVPMDAKAIAELIFKLFRKTVTYSKP